MKICVFTNDFSSQTGVERVTSTIINSLVACGHHVDILSLSRGMDPAYELASSVGLYQLFEDKVSRNGLLSISARRAMRFAGSIAKIRYFFERNDYDVVIDTDFMLGFMAAIALKGKKIKKVHWEHINFQIDPSGSRKRKIRKKLAEMVDGIVVLTERDHQYWCQGAKIKGQIATINNPLPFAPPKVEYNSGTKVVLSIGRFDSQKGYDLLLEAWSKLPRDIIEEGWSLKIVGDGHTKPEMEKLSRTLEVADSVQMPPATKDVDSMYRSASIFCLSSRFEGFGMVLIEAQAYKIPCISFDCDTGPAEIIDHEKNGLLVENRDTDALAKALQELMRSNEKRLSMSANTSQSITRFKPAPITQKWEKFLEDLVSDQPEKQR